MTARATAPAHPCHRRPALAATGVFLAAVAAGCLSPRGASQDADRTAYRIIREKQATALGRNEAFGLGRPEDLLRRRLLLDQALPASGAASFGRDYLSPVPAQPDGVTGDRPLPAGAIVAPAIRGNVEGETTENFSTDLFLNQIGPDPEGGAVPPDPTVTSALDAAPVASEESQRRVLVINLIDALEIGARNSREYQRQKEAVFLTALDLDLERDRFEFRFSGTLDATVATELEGADRAGVAVGPALGVSKLFKSGALLTTRIGVDLARLLTGDKGSSLGLFADATVTIPLLRGAGVEVVTEPLQQAERTMIYSIWGFETFKRRFAVDVASQFLSILGDLDNVTNSTANYRRLVDSTKRAAALFDTGRLPGIQVDQATQQTLRARNRLLLAQQRYEQRLDNFKVTLGLPPDARIVLDKSELERLAPIADRVLGPEAGRDNRVRGELGFGPVAKSARDAATDTDPHDPAGGLEAKRDDAPVTRPAPPATQPTTMPGGDVVGAGGEPKVDAGTVVGEKRATTKPSLPDPREQLDATREPDGGLNNPTSLPAPADPNDLPAGQSLDLPTQLLVGEPANVRAQQAAIRVALQRRLDLATIVGQVADAQRKTVVAANALKAGLDLTGGAGYGGRRNTPFDGDLGNAQLRLAEGTYSAGIALDLPIERTAERNLFRESLISLDQAIRNAQESEDGVKLDVLSDLRDLRVSAEDLRIQAVSISVAERRVEAANLLIELGRGQIRDLTEANDALVTAQNSYTSALIDYRIAELTLQRDLGVLEVDEGGLYRETSDVLPLIGGSS